VYQPSKKVNVLDQQTLKTVFKRDYDRVLLVNGPTRDKDRSGSVFSQGIIEAYFLVQDGKKMFYVDGNGREYLAR
jgi:hypothetical protein